MTKTIAENNKNIDNLRKPKRGWVFTLNNYTEDDILTLQSNKDNYRYIVFGKEIAPTTGTPHLQGYIYFEQPKSKKKVRELTGINKLWLDEAKGNPTQNQTYCSKEGMCFEHGSKPKQGHRTDLDTLKDRIINGTTVDEITMEEPIAYHQYGRTLEKIEDIVHRSKFRTTMTKCIWITGGTGSGKSHMAYENYTPDTHYNLNTDDKGWWEGYKGQKNVIINDFKGEIKYSTILQLIDKWPYSVPRRNRPPMPFTSETIYITSIMKPQEVYHNLNEKDGIDQLLRRVTIIEKSTEDN